MPQRTAIAILVLVMAGCTYDPPSAIFCQEGDEDRSGSVCRDGVWIEVADAGDRDAIGEPCGETTAAELCDTQGFECGVTEVVDDCGETIAIDCGGCDSNAACRSSDCVCDDGFSGDGKTCTEDALCDEPCHEDAMCVASNGDFACVCQDGFTGDGTMCTDVDECSDGTHDCDENATCANEPGGFACECNDGWTGNGTTCSDVDECADDTDDCADGACINTPGGFECSCPDGFRGDGYDCRKTLVESVQTVRATISDGQLSRREMLTDPVQTANSVIFVERRLDSTDARHDDIYAEVGLTASNQLRAGRDGGDGDLSIVATVVEFDPMQVAVQSGTFDFDGNATTVSISPVTESDAFLLFTYRHDSGGDDHNAGIVGGRFLQPGEIEFRREHDAGRVRGRWYVVEALGGGFSVQHASSEFESDTTSASIQSVDRSASFLIYSYGADTNSDNADRANVSCEIAADDRVDCNRSSSQSSIARLSIQVVELAGDEVVEAGTTTLPGDGTDAVDETLATPVDMNWAMAWNGQTGAPGASPANANDADEYPDTVMSAELLDASTVRIQRDGPTNDTADMSWWVVEW